MIWVGRAARPDEEDDEAVEAADSEEASSVVDADDSSVEEADAEKLVILAVEFEKIPVELEDGAEVGTTLPAAPAEMK
jgi:hypothetical protein